MKNKVLFTTLLILLSLTHISFAEINDGLVAYWSFNGNANDESGYGNHGTVNGATLTTDRFGNVNCAYSFDGVDDYISVNDSDSLDLTSRLTISLWVKAEQVTHPSTLIGGHIDSFSFYLYPGNVVGFGKAGKDEIMGSSISLEQWYHLVATRSDGVNKIYIDGLLDTSGPGADFSILNSPIFIAANPIDPGVNNSNVTLDQIKIYNRALTAAEIQQLYNEGSSPPPPPPPPIPAPVAYYPFNGNANDESGNGNHGTVNGATLTTNRFGSVNSAYSFDGANDYVDAGSTAMLDDIEEKTIEAWIYLKEWGDKIIVSKSNGNMNGWNVSVQWRDASGNPTERLCFFQDFDQTLDGGQWGTPEGGISLATWHHIAVVYDSLMVGNHPLMYIDGQLLGTSVLVAPSGTAVSDASENLRIGGMGINQFKGIIDDVAIYGQALTAAQVQQRYNEGSWPNPPTELRAIPGTSLNSESQLQLDATLSTGSAGITYNWLIEGESTAREGMQVSVANLAVGNYRVDLTVSDGTCSDSVPMLLAIPTIAPDALPLAEAGDNQVVINVGTTVQLDGTASYDPHGDPLAYEWMIISKPAGSTAVLNNDSSATPAFTVDVYGDYIIGLTVRNAFTESEPDDVTISFNNITPVADSGNGQACILGETVILDGSGSNDANGDNLSYNWQIILAPAGSTAVLNDATTANPSIQPDMAGLYQISLVVSDSFLNSAPSLVAVTVITVQDATTNKLQTSTATINNLDETSFKNSTMEGTLIEKINEAILMVEEDRIQDAIDKLELDVLRKMDGVANIGAPDKNDWVTDINAQNQVYPLVLDAINLLEGQL